MHALACSLVELPMIGDAVYLVGGYSGDSVTRFGLIGGTEVE